MIRKEMIAMLLAGGQGSRLGVLTADVAKPAVAFGGKYRIIDFPLSNCINSGIVPVGVLTIYTRLGFITILVFGFRWIWTVITVVLRFCSHMRKAAEVNGIQERPMLFTRI